MLKIAQTFFYLGFFYCITFAALSYFQMKVQAYPVPENISQYIDIVFAILMTVTCFLARRKKWAFFLSIIFVFIAANQVVDVFISKGFSYTKRYATEMAHAVEEFHKAQGKWPDVVPPFTAIPPRGWPYDFRYRYGFDCPGLKGPNYCIVAGFHIWYAYKEGLPLLSVSSRQQEIESRYNWNTMQWEDQPRHYPDHD